jgi:hypothetical protein
MFLLLQSILMPVQQAHTLAFLIMGFTLYDPIQIAVVRYAQPPSERLG